MSIVLSCGHQVDDFNHTYTIMTKSTSREGSKAISHQIVCGACEDQYRQRGEIFDNTELAMEWLGSEIW